MRTSSSSGGCRSASRQPDARSVSSGPKIHLEHTGCRQIDTCVASPSARWMMTFPWSVVAKYAPFTNVLNPTSAGCHSLQLSDWRAAVTHPERGDRLAVTCTETVRRPRRYPCQMLLHDPAHSASSPQAHPRLAQTYLVPPSVLLPWPSRPLLLRATTLDCPASSATSILRRFVPSSTHRVGGKTSLNLRGAGAGASGGTKKYRFLTGSYFMFRRAPRGPWSTGAVEYMPGHRCFAAAASRQVR
jgi:hypothetical protein